MSSSYFRPRAFVKSLRYAGQGLRYVIKQEQNFRLQLMIAGLVIVALVMFSVRAIEAIALILVIMFVLILEILNTVLEYFIDLLQPRLHHYSKVIKDMMAAAVLLASCSAISIGILIFIPYIRELLVSYGIL